MTTRKLFSVLVITVFLALAVVGAASAASTNMPVGGCLPGWELHNFMDHNDPEHHHVGIIVDLNGDGYICVFHNPAMKHVHMDNVVPLD